MAHILSSAPESTAADRLFDTAAALFWRQGYGATSTRQIAAGLGIQQAALYYHIASKEDLLYRICVSSLQPFLESVPAIVDRAKCPLEQIQFFIHAHLTTLLRFQQRNVTQLTELRSLSARHRTEVLALRDRYEQFSRSTLQDAQAAGDIRGDVPAKILSLALMSILNHTSLWFRKEKGLNEDELAEMFAKLYLEGAAAPGVRPRLTLPDLGADEKKPVARVRKAPLPANSPALGRALDAAVTLFSRKGYAATSTREVAKLLGIQKATLYYHVESKEDLLFLICRSSLTQIRGDVEAAIRDRRDPLERTQTLICTHLESLLRDQARHSAAFMEMHALSEARFGQIMKLRDDYENLVRSVLREARDAGVLRQDIEVKYLALALLGSMNRAMIWYRRKGPLSPRQIGQVLGALFLGGAATTSLSRIA